MHDQIAHASEVRPRPNLGDTSVPGRARDGAARRRGLAVSAAAVALTAYGGAIALIVGVISLGAELDERIPFESPVFGGVALAVIVGAPFTMVAVAAWRGSDRTDLLTLTAGCLLVGWIVVEYLFIRELSFLHPLYLAIGIGFVLASRWHGRSRVGRP